MKTQAIVAETPIWINTPHAIVSVYGHNLVSKKELVILAKCLTLPEFADNDHGVRSVVFRDDGFPKKKKTPRSKATGVMATACHDSQSITFNLEETWRVSVERAVKYPNISVLAIFHQMQVMNMLHEIHHLRMMLSEGFDTLSADKLKEEEQLAEEWSLETLRDMAKETDIEPSHPADSPYLAQKYMSEIAKADGAWAASQRWLMENHVFYRLENKGVVAMSFKKFVQLASDGEEGTNPEHPAWSKDTIFGSTVKDPAEDLVIDMTKIGNTYVVVEATTAAPVAPVAQAIPTAPVAPAVQVAPVAPVVPAAPNYQGFPVEDEVAEEPQEQMEQAAQPQFAPPAATVRQPVAPQAMAQPVPSTDTERVKALVFGVFNKCYAHLFNSCGPHAGGFAAAQNVYTMGIALTAEEAAVVTAADCLDENGRWSAKCPTNLNGQCVLRGLTSKNIGMPYYKLYISYGGQMVERTLLPQNPLTTSKLAAKAKAGSRIMYVKDTVANEILYKTIDGTWSA